MSEQDQGASAEPTGLSQAEPQEGLGPPSRIAELLGSARDACRHSAAALGECEIVINHLRDENMRLRDALLQIEDLWTLPAASAPNGRKWHCQHEEWLTTARAVAAEALCDKGGDACGSVHDSAGLKGIAQDQVLNQDSSNG